MPSEKEPKILGPNVFAPTDKLYVSSTTKSAKVRRWLPTEKDVIKMYKEKFSQMKKIARKDGITLLNFAKIQFCVAGREHVVAREVQPKDLPGGNVP